ncbi:MAG: polymer-forming cytoskeletal protein [Lachnospiraceae bacterium]|nr:polymer-forming cytoskeletal protein [Lachnospiraceae bacterium]
MYLSIIIFLIAQCYVWYREFSSADQNENNPRFQKPGKIVRTRAKLTEERLVRRVRTLGENGCYYKKHFRIRRRSDFQKAVAAFLSEKLNKTVYSPDSDTVHFRCKRIRCVDATIRQRAIMTCDLVAEKEVSITAPCRFKGNITAGSVSLENAGVINGTITADTVTARDSFQLDDLVCRDFTAEAGNARGSMENVTAEEALHISSPDHKICCSAKSLNGRSVRIDGVNADTVSGEDVYIAPNCIIDTVYYRNYLFIAPGATVRNAVYIDAYGGKQSVLKPGEECAGHWLREKPVDENEHNKYLLAGYDYTVAAGGVPRKTQLAGYDYTVANEAPSTASELAGYDYTVTGVVDEELARLEQRSATVGGSAAPDSSDRK